MLIIVRTPFGTAREYDMKITGKHKVKSAEIDKSCFRVGDVLPRRNRFCCQFRSRQSTAVIRVDSDNEGIVPKTPILRIVGVELYCL